MDTLPPPPPPPPPSNPIMTDGDNRQQQEEQEVVVGQGQLQEQQQQQQLGMEVVGGGQEGDVMYQQQQQQQQHMMAMYHQQQQQLQEQQQQYGGHMQVPMGEDQVDLEAQRTLKVEDALSYLDEVKRQFEDRPQVYNMFLEIMKAFKSEAIDTPGVIQRVSTLFRGHNRLILGFNTFLPPGFRIEAESLPPDGPMPPQAYDPTAAFYPGMPGANQMMYVPHPDVGGMVNNNPNMQPMEMDQQGGQPVEFDQAISYVSRIKRRFNHDPNTYKSFLDILHTYQREQKSIKEVLDQVSELFRDHPDLLKEFTYFLPDAVRDKAKQEINRIAARRKKEEKLKRPATGAASAGQGGGGGGQQVGGARKQPKRDRMDGPGGVSGGGGGRSSSPYPGEEEPLLLNGRIPRLERRLFGRIKSALGTQQRWSEFLKVLDLYAMEVLSRADLITIAVDIFGSHKELLEEFDHLLAARGATDDPTEDAWFSIPLSEIDFGQARRATPSYRALPVSYPRPACSERTALCRQVLNDTWVSVSSGSEDHGNKGANKKNIHEEFMFKCEDDRYELDMVIESNTSAIEALEPLRLEIETITKANTTNNNDGQAKVLNFRLARKSLSVMHLKAIARVYGEHAQEILELLRRAPAAAIPIIIDRLKQKDIELRKQRTEQNKEWKEVMEKNYTKSLDHRSVIFKANDKKYTTAKTMTQELNEAKKMTLEMKDAFAHRHAYELIRTAMEKMTNSTEECEKLSCFFASFLVHLFGYSPSLENATTTTSTTTTSSSSSASPSPNLTKTSLLFTRYGLATPTTNVKAGGGGAQQQINVIFKAGGGEGTIREFAVFPAKDKATMVAQQASNQSTVYVGQQGYFVLRLYCLMCERIVKAERLCEALARDPPKPLVKHVLQRNTVTPPVTSTTTTQQQNELDKFESLMDSIKQLLRGTLDNNKIEDEVHAKLGTGGFFLYSMDKLTQTLVRAIQALMADAVTATKVSDAIKSYMSSKSGATAIDMYLTQQAAVNMGTTVGAAVRVKFLPGEVNTSNSKPYFDDDAWKVPPRLELTICETLPHVTNAPPSGYKPLTPQPGEQVREGGNDIGEIECLEPLPIVVGGEDVMDDVQYMSVFTAKKLPGNDDVFRRMYAWKNRGDGNGGGGDWWKAGALPSPSLSGDGGDDSAEDNKREN